MQRISKYKYAIILFFFTMLLEFSFSNHLSDILHPQPEVPLNLILAETSNKASVNGGYVNFYESGDALELTVEPGTISRNVYLKFSSNSAKPVYGTISIKDESRTEDYNKVNEFVINATGRHNQVVLPVNSRGDITALKIEITGNLSRELILEQVVINYPNGITFHFVRWLFLVGILAVFLITKHYRLGTVLYDTENRRHRLATILVTMVSLAIAIFICGNARTSKSNSIPYPLKKDISSYSILVQQFDAFQKGQLHLDMTLEEGLDQLDNPYDSSQRFHAGNHWNNGWDHVYKDGKLYSYFGVAPILSIYYPYYRITGSLPSDATTAYILMFFVIILCTVLIRQLIDFFRFKVNVLTVLSCILMLPAASYLFLVESSADMYYIPILSAILYSILFVSATFRAYKMRHTTNGIIMCALAGISLVLAVASRPTTVVPFIAFVTPLYIQVLLEKECTIRVRARQAGSFLLPVLAGATGIMIYNVARFGSPTDFGIADQLTIADIHYNKITFSVAHVLTYLRQYWLLPFSMSESFPFVGYHYISHSNSGSYIYHQMQMSILAMPVNLMILFTPVAIKGKTLCKKAMLTAGLTASVLILYFNYCLGGIHLRYTCDCSFVITLIAIVVIMDVTEKLQKHQMHYLKNILVAVVLLSAFIGYMLIFTNERNYILEHSTDTFLTIRNFFTI